MNNVPAGATLSRFCTTKVVQHGHIKQIAQVPPVVITEGQTALVLARAACAAVVSSSREAKRHRLLVRNDEVAGARLGAWRNLDVGLGCRHTLVVFQGLFDITQVEHITCAHGQYVPFAGSVHLGWHRGRPLHMVDLAQNQLQSQRTVLQVLRLGQNTAGDITLGNEFVLKSINHDLNTFGSQASANGRVNGSRCRLTHSVQQILGSAITVCVQSDEVNLETRGFLRRQ